MADILAQALDAGAGPLVKTEAERIATALPAAPAASFKQALQRAHELSWPLTSNISVEWKDVHDAYSYPQSDDQPTTPAVRDSLARTPSQAHLTDLQGSVFRLIELLELHVHDPERVLAAARDASWEPEQDMTHEDNLLDAVMYLAATDAFPPGTDCVTQSGQGEQLSANKGDELADWSPIDVTASFGSGWLLSAESGVG